MATSAADGRAVDTTGTASKANLSSIHSSKTSFAARMTESTRKAEDDATGQTRRAAPRAWTSGVNPITQRPPSSTQPNGVNPRINSSTEKLASDRQAWFYGNAVGLECKCTMKTGHAFMGVLVAVHKLSSDDKLVLKMVKHSSNSNTDEAINVTYTGFGPEHKMVVLASSISTFEVPQAPPVLKQHTANGGFRTDADIGGGNQAFRERVLQRWEAGPADTSVDLSLESSAGGWDQFKVNEARFGVKSDYDENMYTTQIDRKNPLYAMREREAERIAREIESQTSTNAHIREERGIMDDGDDEEEKYSGVRRDFAALQSTQPNRYIPPSRRNQAATETAAAGPLPPKDAHIDPAIISSQIARSTETDVVKAGPSPTTNNAPVPGSDTTLGNSNESHSPAAASKDIKRTRQTPKPSGVVAANNIEQKVLDSFHQFSANEKIKIQDQKRTRASADKAVRINDLMKFSQNFKLLTPVPKDLVPILAKDEVKQKEIIQKAQQAAESSQSSKIATFIDTPKSVRQPSSGRWEVNTVAATAVSQGDRSRQTSVPQSALPSDRPQHPQVAPASLSAKLSDHHRAHKAGAQPSLPPPPTMIEPRRDSRGSAQTSGLSSPQKPPSIRGSSSTSGAKLNVKAMEFKPTAVPFKPASSATTAVASSPRSGPTTRTISPAVVSIKFFADQVMFANRKTRQTPASVAKQKSIDSTKELASDGSTKTNIPPIPASQGGFQFPYRTAPTWTHSESAENEADYKAVFVERRPRRFNTPHPHASPSIGMQPHFPITGHLPQGTHGMPHVQAPHQNLHQMHQQPPYGHPQNFEDHHMRPSPSNSSHFPSPSPRMQPQNMAYTSPMPGHAHMAYPPHMQYPMQTPPMGARQFSNGPGMGPMQGGHLAPMMVQHHSTSGFMPQQMGMPYNGQIPMYASPVPAPAMYGSPNQQSSGFPSPGRAAPMMVHQGSQQGQQPMYMPANQYGQPMYTQQSTGHIAMRPAFSSPQPAYGHHPYPPHQYPQQVHRTPSQGYVHPHHTPQQQHATPQQAPPLSAPSTDVGEEVK